MRLDKIRIETVDVGLVSDLKSCGDNQSPFKIFGKSYRVVSYNYHQDHVFGSLHTFDLVELLTIGNQEK